MGERGLGGGARGGWDAARGGMGGNGGKDWVGDWGHCGREGVRGLGWRWSDAVCR